MSAPSQHPPGTDELPGAILKDLQFYPRKAPSNGYEMGGYNTHSNHIKPVLDHMTCVPATLTPIKQGDPYQGVELQASAICPRNFIIFDQTNNGSRIMFHPAMAHKFPSLDLSTIYSQEKDVCKENSHNEDTKDIDALLSLEEDEEEVSTGRTGSNYGSSSPDCTSTIGSSESSSKSSKSSWSCNQKPCPSKSGAKRRRQRMQRMVKALRGIIPGGDGMDTAAVLTEAVKYLKSLKVEVKKLGIGKLKRN